MSSKRSRRKTSHRLRNTISIAIIVIVVIYVITFLLLPIKPIIATQLANPLETSGSLNVAWPNSEEAAVGVLGSGSLMTNGPQNQTQTASIAKLVTALCVLKKEPLSPGEQGPTITISASDVADYNNFLAEDGSVVKVALGEQITEYQAIQAMLLPSANNMADTLANWAFGNTANYLTFANKYVKSIGMNTTTISDPSGFSPNTVSTSNDLIKLGEASLYNPIIAQIVDQPSAVLPVAGLVKNVDFYLGQDDLIGIKTGNTDQAGGCFLSAAKYSLGNGSYITIIGVVLKAPSLQLALNDTIPMLASVKDQLEVKSLTANTPLSTYKLPWGGSVNSVTNNTISIPYLPGLPIDYSNLSSSVKAPLPSGSLVGRVLLGVGNDQVKTALVLSQNIPEPTALWRLTHPQYFIR